MPDSPTAKRDDLLKEHELVERLVKVPGQPPNVVRLGPVLIGKSGLKDHIIGYTSLEFNQFFEVLKDDIIATVDAPEGRSEPGAKYLFVKGEAEVKLVRIQTTTRRAEFFKGPISSAYLRPVAGYRVGRMTPWPQEYVETSFNINCLGVRPEDVSNPDAGVCSQDGCATPIKPCTGGDPLCTPPLYCQPQQSQQCGW